MVLRIRNWQEHYENNRSREIKELKFVLIPNRMDTEGYTALMDHPNGAAHLGAWVAILQIASRCSERGTLRNSDGKPHTSRTLARISRIPSAVFEEVIPRLLSEEIFWIEQVVEIPQEGAVIPQEGATPTRVRVPFSSIQFSSPEEKKDSEFSLSNEPFGSSSIARGSGMNFDAEFIDFRAACIEWAGSHIVDPEDFHEAWAYWKLLDGLARGEAIAGIRSIAAAESPPDKSWRPKWYLKGKEWKRTHQPRLTARERALAKI